MDTKNWTKIEFPSETVNVSFARTAAAMFAAQLDFSIDELEDIKVAVSEAVSNCIIHGYKDSSGIISMRMEHQTDRLYLEIEDYGCGFANIEQAKEAGYSSVPEERMGLGLVFIHEYMDDVQIESQEGGGTKLILYKNESLSGKAG